MFCLKFLPQKRHFFNASRQTIMALKKSFTSAVEDIQERRLQLNVMRIDSTVMLQSKMFVNINQ